jgi:hypothetical protein
MERLESNFRAQRQRGPWQVSGDRLGYAFSLVTRITLPMTNRVAYAPHDFQKMCKQAERDHESKKLVLLMERVKRQIAARQNPGARGEASRPPIGATGVESGLRLPSRSVPLER